MESAADKVRAVANNADALNKVRVVADALQYVRRYHGKTLVVKYGGAAMRDEKLRDAFARDVLSLQLTGVHPVIVHGGGPQINVQLEKIGKKSNFVDGLRYTDGETMDIVEMVLGGQVNQDIVRLINKAGGRAVGLTGKDGGLLLARKLRRKPGAADVGLVGEVEAVDARVLSLLQSDGFIPVIAPIAADADGQTLNINADTAAAKIAAALGAEALFLLTNTAGVLDKRGKLLVNLTVDKARKLIKDGVIDGGMRPKVECAVDALKGGVASCRIINGETQHALLLEAFTAEGAGTYLTP